jgi:cytochrome b6-f complex iron-sulfur subunit
MKDKRGLHLQNNTGKPIFKGRRNLLTRILFGWFFIILMPALYVITRYLLPQAVDESKYERLDAGKLSILPDLSLGPKLLRSKGKAIFLYRNEQNQVKAFSGICTHLGCLVEYSRERRLFKCNCHGSEFDLNGKNISGPAMAPLQPYRSEIENGEVYIIKGIIS